MREAVSAEATGGSPGTLALALFDWSIHLASAPGKRMELIDWSEWLARHSAPDRVAPPAIGATEKGYPPMDDAPGTYVLQR